MSITATKSSNSPDLVINNMDLQLACDLIEDMTDVQQNKMAGMIIYSGRSEKFGLVHIVLGTDDSAVVLPWLSNVFPTGDQASL